MDEHAPAGTMGMRILLRRFTMGRPPRVTDPGGPTKTLFAQRLFQIDQFADATADLDFAVAMDRDAGRIVSAIFQTLQAIQENGNRVLITDVSDNAAHGAYPFFILRLSEVREARRGAGGFAFGLT
jgi:hypothetical protein